MERASVEAFTRGPVGRWALTAPTGLTWCATRERCGAVVWGRPSADHARAMLQVFEAYRGPWLAPRFDVILDARGIEAIDPDALEVLVDWAAARRVELAARIREQVGLVTKGVAGLTLAGILPLLGETHAFRVTDDARGALRDLHDEVEAIAAAARGVAPELRALRDLLRDRKGDVSLEDAARALRASVRSLQRLLQQNGTSWRDEAREARFLVAEELLGASDLKVSVVAARVGLSETALAQLVKEKTGLTPGELRLRGAARGRGA